MHKLMHSLRSTHFTSKTRLVAFLVFLLIVALLPILIINTRSTQQIITRAATSSLTVTSVASDNSSVRVTYQPVSGAKDYRIYDVTNPRDVKYAGLDNSDNPATQIDYNSVGDGLPHTLIVEAVDMLGPVSHANLYDPNTNAPLVSPLPTGAMLGSNKGPTDDGNVSTNGQGPYTNNPQVLATSQPFIVQANRNYKAIPSKSDAISTFFDTFENSEASTIHQTALNASNESMRFTLNTGTPLSATIQYQLVDTLDSMPFITNNHFMDVLFDGGTPGTNNPLHQGHGVMAFSPDQIANLSNGQMLHITEEFDAHMDSRRWMDIVIVPANDPAVAFDADTSAYNQTNHAVRLQIVNGCTLDIYTGPSGGTQVPTGTAGGSFGSALWGAAGQAPIGCYSYPYNGLSFDSKSRFDFFITQSHAAFFVDGILADQSDIPSGSFSWFNQPVKIYFSHYLYHTDNDINELLTYNCQAMNSFWFNDPLTGTLASQDSCKAAYPAGYGFQRSDERHWDNMGFEVLPASDVPGSDWSSLASLVQPPTAGAPVFVTGSVTQSPSPTPTPAPNTINISNFQFSPQTLTIPVGTTVSWINTTTSTTHTSTSDTGVWNSGNITPGNSFSFTFSTPGTYPYHCSIHTSMTGTIIVTGSTLTPTPLPPTLTPLPSPTSTPLPPSPTTIGRIQGDLNPTPDGKVCIDDLSIMAKDWGRGPNATPPTTLFNPLSDINGDGIVNISDLSLLAKNWGC